MYKKSQLLKELGWDDKLIKHYMVEDSEEDVNVEQELVAEVFDTHTMTVTFSAENNTSSFIINEKI